MARRRVRALALYLSKTRLAQRFLRLVLPQHLDLCAEVLGRNLRSHLREHLDLCVETLGRYYNDQADFASVTIPVQTIAGFEDLMWLFTPNPVNRGLARLDLDETAYLYRLLRSLPSVSCVEIGRFKGGSTFLIAAALRNGSKLLSIDNHSKMNLPEMGPIYDQNLMNVLQRFGLAERVTLAVGDSGTYPVKPKSVDVLFCDGDHTYEGVSRDFDHWRPTLRPGGHLLLHDAAQTRPFATYHEGVGRLVSEIESEPAFYKVAEAGSLVHFALKNEYDGA